MATEAGLQLMTIHWYLLEKWQLNTLWVKLAGNFFNGPLLYSKREVEPGLRASSHYQPIKMQW
jgi:hypothetical protein